MKHKFLSVGPIALRVSPGSNPGLVAQRRKTYTKLWFRVYKVFPGFPVPVLIALKAIIGQKQLA